MYLDSCTRIKFIAIVIYGLEYIRKMFLWDSNKA